MGEYIPNEKGECMCEDCMATEYRQKQEQITSITAELHKRHDLIELQDAYTATKPLITTIINEGEDIEDFLRGLRILLKLSNAGSTDPAANYHIEGLTNVLGYLATLKQVAQSYHRAVGKAVGNE